tara:strand:+ start:3805 stop:4404 length:600 start_codon:yes stop_codon:yes gene_type:complete
MKNVVLINGHQPFPTSPGKLNASLCEIAKTTFEARGKNVRLVRTAQAWDLETEIENQLWADLILLQFPLNSMGAPWSLKRYLDEVYTAGMDGRLARGDGRTRSDPRRKYGSGGLMQGRSYMLSVTLNAPQAAFADPAQTLFAGRTLDDLLAPLHINFAFFGLEAHPTFAAHDVSKAPDAEGHFAAFRDHLSEVMAEAED